MLRLSIKWDPLWQGYLRFYESEVPDEMTNSLWKRILSASHEIQCRVAESSASGHLTGLVHFFPHAHTWYADPVCYLNDLFVSPDARGAGIGEMLIQAVVDEARRQGWQTVYWHTQDHNSVARGLYDKITGGTDGFINYTIQLSE